MTVPGYHFQSYCRLSRTLNHRQQVSTLIKALAQIRPALPLLISTPNSTRPTNFTSVAAVLPSIALIYPQATA